MQKQTDLAAVIAQLGGPQIFALAFTEQFRAGTGGIVFRVAKVKGRKASFVTVTIQPDDLYAVEFVKVSGGYNFSTWALTGVHCEDLRATVEREIGLYLTLR